ncbi:MAG: PilW family protein [Gammaproteobacteria bacterium]|nr:PilW family protein [Gammaproteobacteria bacterium]
MKHSNCRSTLLSFQKGFSLIELMISLVISLILIAGTASILVNNSSAYRSNDDLSRLQENLRIASQILTRDLRMAGYFGCADNMEELANPFEVSAPGSLLDTTNAYEGSESGGNWQPSDNSDVTADILANTDAVTVRFLVGGAGLDVQTSMSTVTQDISIPAGNNLVQGAIAGIFDCETTDIFQVANADASATGTVAHGTALAKIYSDEASIAPASFVRYFIGDGANGPSLFRQVFDPTTNGTVTQELVEGIENMQILWGVDNDGDKRPDTYISADAGVNWPAVVSIRYALLGRTLNDYGDAWDNSTYNVNGTDVVAPGDRRVRRVLSNTILLRNFQS